MRKILLTILLFLSVCGIAEARFKTSDLVLSYNFEDSPGTTTISDGSGLNNYGTRSGCISTLGTTTASSVLFGGGMYFNGTSDYVSISSNRLIPSSNVTMMGYFMPYSTPGATSQVLVAQGVGTASQIRLLISSTGSKFSFSVNGGANEALSNSAPTLKQKYHVAGVYNSSASPKTVLYIDGVLQSTTANVSANYSSTNCKVGMSTSGATNTCFNGIADNVKIYNRALSVEEIRCEMLGMSFED